VQTRIGVRLAGIITVGVITALSSMADARATVPVQQDAFEISGEVNGLYPGANTTLEAHVTNPQPFTIRVTSVATAVEDANPSCPGSMLEIGDVRAPVDVPSGATGSVPLTVQMDGNAPDACEGTIFTLEFVATATDTVTDTGGPASRSSPPNSVGHGSLAFTGTDIVKVLAIALALVALGVLARRAAHRRRRTAP
jgi:hypothetical protein